jgi:hypothetical protein
MKRDDGIAIAIDLTLNNKLTLIIDVDGRAVYMSRIYSLTALYGGITYLCSGDNVAQQCRDFVRIIDILSTMPNLKISYPYSRNAPVVFAQLSGVVGTTKWAITSDFDIQLPDPDIYYHQMYGNMYTIVSVINDTYVSNAIPAGERRHLLGRAIYPRVDELDRLAQIILTDDEYRLMCEFLSVERDEWTRKNDPDTHYAIAAIDDALARLGDACRT